MRPSCDISPLETPKPIVREAIFSPRHKSGHLFGKRNEAIPSVTSSTPHSPLPSIDVVYVEEAMWHITPLSCKHIQTRHRHVVKLDTAALAGSGERAGLRASPDRETLCAILARAFVHHQSHKPSRGLRLAGFALFWSRLPEPPRASCLLLCRLAFFGLGRPGGRLVCPPPYPAGPVTNIWQKGIPERHVTVP